jgi:hypothetical protein
MKTATKGVVVRERPNRVDQKITEKMETKEVEPEQQEPEVETKEEEEQQDERSGLQR